MHKPGVITNNATVRAEIQRLYRKGIRYAFPVHLINNSFGGAAVYDMMFSFANKRANGTHFMVTKSPDPLVTYNAAELKGFENVAISAVRGLLDGIGQLPAPCFNDLIKCSPPPGKVQCCGSYQSILNAMTPTREVEIYKVIPPGHVNVLGLTPLGEVAINEMMKLGMMIDVDHMSELAMTKTIDIAEKVPGITYPLVMGHNGVRVKSVDAVSERSAPLALIRRVARLGGMVGAGTADITPDKFIANYRSVWAAMGGRAVGIGTDVNGMEPLPQNGRQSVDPAMSDNFYRGFFANMPMIKSKQITGTRTWDYILDKGVSHYGIMPEFVHDVQTKAGDVYGDLMQSAEHFAQMWEKCEVSAKKVIPGP